MTGRTVFKIFGSLGPGGSVITLLEKVCARVFNEAYELGDEGEMQAEEETLIKTARQDYVNELFDFKSNYERRANSLDVEIQQEALDELAELLDKHKKKISLLEKQKLARERVFYMREENDVKY